jgi:cellulose biosynthesis protein BcsQ
LPEPIGPTRVVTFYSYKGGVGRTMALVNTAHVLALQGYRVLMVDFDLEAPGMTHFFAEQVRSRPSYVRKDSLDLLLDAKRSLEEARQSQKSPTYPTSLAEYVIPLPLPEAFRDERIPYQNGRLDFIPATLEPDRLEEASDDGPPLDYVERLGDLDLASLFQPGGPGHLFGDHVRKHFVSARFEATGDVLFALRDPVKAAYDFVLIDSRTGLSEIAGFSIGTIADALVLCCGLNQQNIEGMRYFVRKTGLYNHDKAKPFVVAVGPVPPWQTPEVDERLQSLRSALRRSQSTGRPPDSQPDGMEAVTEDSLAIEYDYPQLVEIPYHPLAAIRETMFVTELPRDSITKGYFNLALQVQLTLQSSALEGAQRHLSFVGLVRNPTPRGIRAYCEFTASKLPEARVSPQRGVPIPTFPSAYGLVSLPEPRQEIQWEALSRIPIAAAVSALHSGSREPFERAWSAVSLLYQGKHRRFLACCLIYFQAPTSHSPTKEANAWFSLPLERTLGEDEEILSSVCAHLASLKLGSYRSDFQYETKNQDALNRVLALFLARRSLFRPILRWSSFGWTFDIGLKLLQTVERLVSGTLSEDPERAKYLKTLFKLPATPEEILLGTVKHASLNSEMSFDRSIYAGTPVGFWPEPLAATAAAVCDGPDAIQEILAWIHLARLHYGYAWRVLLDWRYFEEVKQHPDFQAFLQQEDEAVASIEDAIDRGVYPL